MNRLLAFSLLVLSALPFTAPFDVIGFQPIAGVLSAHWQTSTGTCAPDVDPSALTVPPLHRVQLPADAGSADFGPPVTGSIVGFIVVSHIVGASAGISPPDPPTIRPLVLRL